MHATILQTFPFLFPDYPAEKIVYTPLQPGPDGLFGVVIQPSSKITTKGIAASFYEIDMRKKEVQQLAMTLPYRDLALIELYYDLSRAAWMVAITGDASLRPLDIYQMPHESGQPWMKLFGLNSLEGKYQQEKALVTFWQEGDSFPLLFSVPDVAIMYDAELYWTQWKPLPLADKSPYQYLGTAYNWLTHRQTEGLLLFTFQCQYDEVLDTVSRFHRHGPGHWHIDVAAYTSSGMLLHQETLPDVTFPIEDLKLASNDLFHWLSLHMSAIIGPSYGPEGIPTCVAALILEDKPGFLGTWKSRGEHIVQKPQGGLYCVDMHGHLLQHDTSLSGEQISFCVCGEKVIGTHLFDGQRPLWSWFPFGTSERKNHMFLSPDIQRVTVIAPDKQKDQEISWFWCIEEHVQGIRVVRRESDQLQELEATWCKGVSLPEWRYAPYLWDSRPLGLRAYQDSLLLLVVNQHQQMQLLQVQ